MKHDSTGDAEGGVEGARTRLYTYKVLVNQATREFRYVSAASIAEAERHGIVVILVGLAGC